MSNMDGYKSPIITSVAYPPTLFFVPFELAGLNFAISIALMLFGVAWLHTSPVFWVVLLVFNHILLAMKSSRDPHFASLARSAGKFTKKRHNFSPEKDTRAKYVP